MHDIDRNQTESGYEMENTPFQSYEMEDPYQSEQPPYQSEQPVFNEADEMEFVNQLMEMETEEEFEGFLGDLIRKAASAVGGYISSQTGQSLGSLLKGAARQILPIVTQAVGAGEAGDFEGEDPYSESSEGEDQEWEAANTFVKLAGEAAKIAAQPSPDVPPADVADQAVTQAAQIHAPALVGPAPSGPVGPRGPGSFRVSIPMRHRRRQGRWVRRGNQIILFGA